MTDGVALQEQVNPRFMDEAVAAGNVEPWHTDKQKDASRAECACRNRRDRGREAARTLATQLSVGRFGGEYANDKRGSGIYALCIAGCPAWVRANGCENE